MTTACRPISCISHPAPRPFSWSQRNVPGAQPKHWKLRFKFRNQTDWSRMELPKLRRESPRQFRRMLEMPRHAVRGTGRRCRAMPACSSRPESNAGPVVRRQEGARRRERPGFGSVPPSFLGAWLVARLLWATRFQPPPLSFWLPPLYSRCFFPSVLRRIFGLVLIGIISASGGLLSLACVIYV